MPASTAISSPTFGWSSSPATHRLVGQHAENVTVGNGERGTDAAEQALVIRYAAAVAPIGKRVIGHLTAAATKSEDR